MSFLKVGRIIASLSDVDSRSCHFFATFSRARTGHGRQQLATCAAWASNCFTHEPQLAHGAGSNPLRFLRTLWNQRLIRPRCCQKELFLSVTPRRFIKENVSWIPKRFNRLTSFTTVVQRSRRLGSDRHCSSFLLTPSRISSGRRDNKAITVLSVSNKTHSFYRRVFKMVFFSVPWPGQLSHPFSILLSFIPFPRPFVLPRVYCQNTPHLLFSNKSFFSEREP